MMRPDDPVQRRAIMVIVLLLTGASGIGLVLYLLPWAYTLIFVALVIPIMAFVRWRWGEAIDRWLLGG
ncbi:MAG: hypothetical protein F4Z25_13445 [Chloroflexi bacterium]|nr:hypothetical protein [Chloroflexota bacterium]